MKIRRLFLFLGILGVSQAQKHGKHGQGQKHGGGQGQHGDPYAQGQYNPAHHGGNLAHQPAAKATYPLLLSDSRTLNQDGTINFQYAADNGLQQGETVDADGTRRGFYSYPGADGKQITVKYTAGKNGFIAEGDHLPKQPIVPGHVDGDEGAYNYPAKGHSPQVHSPHEGNHQLPIPQRGHSHQPHRAHHAPPPAYDNPQQNYNLAHAPAPQFAHGGAPRFGGGAQGFGGHGGHGGHRPQQHSSPEGQDYQGISPAGAFGRGQGGFDFGPVNYGAPSQSTNKYKAPPPPSNAAPRPLPHGGQNIGAAFSPLNQDQAGPFNGNFDLGNGGQFAINFSPGQSREVATGGDYSNFPQNGAF